MKIRNPATGAVLSDVAEDKAASIKVKAEAAARAQHAWARAKVEDRLAIVRKFRSLVVERKDRLAALLTSEVGKPITQSRSEIDGTLVRIDYFLAKVPEALRPQPVHRDDTIEERITHEPLGVVANVSAWNYPWYVGSNVFLPALLTGNAVLYKPSEIATLTGLAMEGLFTESGLPDSLFQAVIGPGRVGQALVSHPLVRGVFFTGSYAVGKKISAAVAGNLVRLQLELGGKDPVYVADDVDIPAAAAATADGAFYNAGQSCCAIERLYVHKAIYGRFVETFVATVKGFRVGDPTDPKTYLGPVARSDHLDVLEDQISDALQRGARLLCGGRRMKGRGNFFEPTVLDRCTHDMAVMRDETFGPVIGLMSVDDDDQARELMADTPYGLTAGVYSKDRARAEHVLAQLDTGTAYVNCCDRVTPRLPWSGRGHSGIGTTLSTQGIHAFLQPKSWHVRS